MSHMSTINFSDVIFASIIKQGCQIATFRLSGLSSFKDAVYQLRCMINSKMGLVTVKFRNSTQGWCHDRSMMLTPITANGVQLTLF